MDQTKSSDQNVNPGSPSVGGQQGHDPHPYPQSYYPQQWQQQPPQPVQPTLNLPVQQPQPVGTGVSPESPARVEQSEQYIAPEAPSVPEKSQDIQENKAEQKVVKEEEVTKEATEIPQDKQKFESPFRVYGYQVMQKNAALGKRTSSSTVKGNPSLSSTWLIVLLGRLLRLKHSEALEAS